MSIFVIKIVFGISSVKNVPILNRLLNCSGVLAERLSGYNCRRRRVIKVNKSSRERVYRVLFLCTGNSARSIIAESLVNHNGAGRFVGYSAGSHPRGEVHPRALELLLSRGHDIENLRSKSWYEFEMADAPSMDFVFTVCDNAANEPCPVWPGRPVTAHWGLADPAGVGGTETERREAFTRTYELLEKRIAAFLSLPFESLKGRELENKLGEAGRPSS